MPARRSPSREWSGRFFAAEPQLHREFYGTGVPVTDQTVDEFIKTYVEATPSYDWNDLWGRVSGQIRQG